MTGLTALTAGAIFIPEHEIHLGERSMARLYGKPVDLEGEILNYLRRQRFGAVVTRFLIRDYIIGARNIDCKEEELESAIWAIEQRFGVFFDEGSRTDSIKSASPRDIIEELCNQQQGYLYLSKLDELVLRKKRDSEPRT